MSSETPAAAASGSASTDLALHVADVLIAGCIDRPLASLLPVELIARLAHDFALALLRDPQADARLVKLYAQLQAGLRRLPRLRAAVPPDFVLLAKELLRLPHTPDRALLVALLSRPPFRRLNRELMTGTLVDYSRRIRSTLSDPNAGRNLGMLGRLATQAVQKGTAAVGAVAGGVASVVTDELERQMQRRAGEFAEGAVDELVGRLATTLTDPARAAEHVELKLSLLDFALDLPGESVAAELARVQPATVVVPLRAALLRWLDRPQATEDLVAALRWLYAQDVGLPGGEARAFGDRSVAEIVGSTELLAAVQSALRTLVAQLVRPSVASGALRQALSSS